MNEFWFRTKSLKVDFLRLRTYIRGVDFELGLNKVKFITK